MNLKHKTMDDKAKVIVVLGKGLTLTPELEAKIKGDFGDEIMIVTPEEAERLKLTLPDTAKRMNEVFPLVAPPIVDMPYIEDGRREPKNRQQHKYAQQHFNRKMSQKFRK